MFKLLQISIEVNANSVGKIAEQIGETAIEEGWESYITYARDHRPSKSKLIRIGSKFDIYWHGLMTRLFDCHCLCSTKATKRLIKQIEEINPDVIHLHHIHGYFLNMKVLFEYLSRANKPVVWTFHDCWSFTGHCAHFFDVKRDFECEKWKTGCFDCRLKSKYPRSMLADRSYENYNLKKQLFTSVKDLVVVPVSDWLASVTKQSFLKNLPIHPIYNGIDINIFSPKSVKKEVRLKYNIPANSFFILGVASVWNEDKGLNDFYYLRTYLPETIGIVLVGLSESQIKKLPVGIIGIRRTYDMEEMAELYTSASVFVNPTYNDTFPTVNLEAQACGTPVVTYRTGGSPETIENGRTGLVVERGNKDALAQAILDIYHRWDLEVVKEYARERVVRFYDKRKKYKEYMALYGKMINRK